MPYFLNSPSLTAANKLQTLVENKSTYSFSAFELNVFETHSKAEQINLTFSDFVLTSMFRGKKVMHLRDKVSFDYLPGESVVVAPGETMCIDFPDACAESPTQCLAIEVAPELIDKTVDKLNDQWTRPEACGHWAMRADLFHLMNNEQLGNAINRLVQLSMYEHHTTKDVLLDLTMQEMLVRLMQTQARTLLLSDHNRYSASNPMAAVVDYMAANLTQSIAVEQLAQLACMSRAGFFRKFKELFGIPPAKMMLHLRIEHAKKLLRSPDVSVSEAAFSSGFENLSHFVTAFKREVGVTPGAFRTNNVPN